MDLAPAAGPRSVGRLLARSRRGVRTLAHDMAAKKRATAKREAPRPGLTRMGALRRFDEAAWEREIRKAMEAAEGRIPDAAEALGVSTRTLYLWLEDQRFRDVERAPQGVRRT